MIVSNGSGEIIKVCTKCGRSYTCCEWKKLPFAGGSKDGLQKYPWGEVQELRNCTCGTTLSLVLDEGDYDLWMIIRAARDATKK